MSEGASQLLTAVVVNDDSTQLRVQCGLVRKAGLEPLPFANAGEALDAMRREASPALVVTDLYMPGIDGWRFCRLLRSPEYAAFNRVPILVVSATFSGDHPERIAADIGADAFLASPLDGKTFVARIQALLRGEEARHQPRALIVEDSKTLAKLLREAFCANGWQADMALTAKEAEEFFLRTPYDVAVLDYHLPDAMGDSLLDAFRARSSDCVCLMMTTDPTPELALDWMKRGAAAYLRKPFEPEFLIELCTRARRECALVRAEDLLDARTRELRESEERYRDFFESINDAAFVHELCEDGRPGRFLAVNRAACQRLGYTREELLCLTPRDIAEPEEFERIAPRRGEFKDRGNLLLETIHVAKDGRRIPVEGNIRVITFQGRLAALSVSRDITERRRTAAALRESEERYRRITERITDYIYTVRIEDGTAVETHHGPGCCAVTGYEEADFDHDPGLWLNMVPPEDRQAVIEQSQRTVAGEVAETLEHRIIRKDGRMRWVSNTPVLKRDGQGDLIGYDGLITDITERKAAEEALRLSEANLRAIMANTSDIIASYDRERRLVACNQACREVFRRLLGVEIQPGFRPLDALPESMREALNACTERVLAGETFVTEIELPPTDGGRQVFELAYHPIRQGAETVGFSTTSRDITERKRAEEELARATALLQAAIEQTPAGMLIADAPDVTIRLANPAALGIRGESAEPLTGIPIGLHPRHWLTFWPDGTSVAPEDLPLSRAILKGETIKNEEVIICRSDGEPRHVLANAAPVRNTLGEIVAGVVVFPDVTDLKRAEAALRLDEERLEVLVALNNMTGADERELTHFAMEAAVRLTNSTIGYVAFMNEDETVLTMDAWSEAAMRECAIADKPLVYPVATTGLWGEAVRRRQPVITNDYSAPNPFKKGTPYGHVNVTRHMNAPTFDDGRIVIVAGVGNKPTEYGEDDVRQLSLLMSGLWTLVRRKRSEEALRRSEERLFLATHATRTGIWDWDVERNLLVWDDSMYRLYGTHREDFAGTYQTWLQCVHADDRERANSEVQAALRGEKEYVAEFRIVWPDGSLHFIQAGAQAFRDKDGKPLRMIGTNIDITERKKAEEEKEKLQAQLVQAQKMESVGRLAGGVAHDFNNMLQVILGNTALALADLPPESPVRESLQEVQRCAERSADLTRQLLAFARKQTVSPKVIDLNEVVEGMLKMLRRLIGEDIELAWLPGADRGPVYIDPSQVDQILANLCVNARDAITGTGRISIETANVVLDQDYCSKHAGFVPGAYVLLAVSDDGCGMDAETLSHLFEPFFTTKETGKGTGLGLATVYGAVKQNHGFINVYSERGRGTTVKIYLPNHAAKAADRPKQGPARAAEPGNATILLVEDESSILRMTKLVLERLGYAVLAADTPGEAIRLAREHPGRIDLLMTDVVMPEMNGRDLARNLIVIYPDIKRLFTSGYTADVIAHHGVLDEGVHFLQKPFSVPTLAAKVSEVLGN